MPRTAAKPTATAGFTGDDTDEARALRGDGDKGCVLGVFGVRGSFSPPLRRSFVGVSGSDSAGGAAARGDAGAMSVERNRLGGVLDPFRLLFRAAPCGT